MIIFNVALGDCNIEVKEPIEKNEIGIPIFKFEIAWSFEKTGPLNVVSDNGNDARTDYASYNPLNKKARKPGEFFLSNHAHKSKKSKIFVKDSPMTKIEL